MTQFMYQPGDEVYIDMSGDLLDRGEEPLWEPAVIESCEGLSHCGGGHHYVPQPVYTVRFPNGGLWDALATELKASTPDRMSTSPQE